MKNKLKNPLLKNKMNINRLFVKLKTLIPKKNKTNQKILSIKTRLITVCILFAIIPLLVVNIISSSISKKALHNTSQQLTSELVKQVSHNINSFIIEVDKNVTQFAVVDLLQGGLISDYTSEDILKKLSATREMQQRLLYLETMDKNIRDAVLVINDKDVLGDINYITKEDLLTTKDLDLEAKPIWMKELGASKNSLFYLKSVTALSKNTKATIVIEVNPESVIQTINNIQLLDNSNLYITDHEGRMIYNGNDSEQVVKDSIWQIINRESAFGTEVVDNTLVTYSILPNGWHIIAEIPERSLTSQLEASSMMVWLLILAVGLLAVLIGTLVSKGFSTPIIKLMSLMKHAEEGDLTVTMPEKGNDEITSLCRSFNHMIFNMRKLLSDTKLVVVHTLDDSNMLRTSTEQSVETFEQLTMSIGEIAQATTHQAEDAQHSSEVMSNLSCSIQDVMQKSNTLFEKNQGAKEMIQAATKSIDLLSQTMSSSIEASAEIQKSIIELSTLTKSIEAIMKLVDGISEQTNLLALNASIEAARAGEVGKGFAVVAHEVRNLAEQSKSSTVNVRKTLHTIETKTKDTVALVKKSSSIFASQENAVKDVHTTFFNIINNLKNMDIDLEQVNIKVQDMHTLKDEMAGKIDNIATVTQESAASTQEVSALSEEQKAVVEKLYDLSNRLTDTMNTLNNSIQTFKVE
ncbi:methyl-accepting chemotaxis protein [Cellulosilyticum sp. I15G10I2]|uniref:methyl-accepting chemotaxis protein n=1 Tax=Cellulosilyticum sp. I15G10I2 TaxID=1892843 RepID=UPI00085C4359|nr:methyl-accepting chemotaxis protein [Cellulosilyticum sp. I15G10I2]